LLIEVIIAISRGKSGGSLQLMPPKNNLYQPIAILKNPVKSSISLLGARGKNDLIRSPKSDVVGSSPTAPVKIKRLIFMDYHSKSTFFCRGGFYGLD